MKSWCFYSDKYRVALIIDYLDIIRLLLLHMCMKEINLLSLTLLQ